MNIENINIDAPTDLQLYSDAVVSNGLVFTTGQMPLDADWNLVSTDVAEQARYVFGRLVRLLAASGSSPREIIRLTVYLADIDDVAALAPARREFLGDARPASVMVEVSRFGTPGMRLEVEAIARVGRA
ncbi:RidA family protein [Microbacterium sp. 2MCAF23]|uniref:RidA family protein n=1 Tax=Microbacterium sp. 2MCAF23 TaxID=3232985 RepID=UPI003F9C028F